MDEGTEPTPAVASRGAKGSKVRRLTIDEERVIAADVPAGSRFKGYEDFLVQDLVLRPRVVRLRRERWLTPDGRTVTAPMPAGIVGHFGPELRRFVLFQYHQGQVTVPRLVAQLRAIGIAISKRQVVRLLNEGQSTFLDEARDVLRAGLSTAGWISADDTGARHQHRNAVCTQLGNDRFAAFATTASKSRLNFLEVLRAGFTDYVINAEALAYMRQRALAGPVIASLAEHPERHFADEAAWLRHLERLGIAALTVTPDPVRIATEGAVWGSVKAHGLLPDAVILSDDAGQFALDRHALCWVHAERLVHKLDTFTDRQHTAQQLVRALIWWFYADLNAARRTGGAGTSCGRGSTASSAAAPGSPPSTACWPGCTRTRRSCWSCSTGPRCRCTPTARSETCGRRWSNGKSPAARARIGAALAATPSSACCRPAPSWVCRSGIISATASPYPTLRRLTCPTSSGSAPLPPERPAFCPSYRTPQARAHPVKMTWERA
jgi:hypothetical protein